MVKIQFDVPKSMIDFCHTKTAKSKLYDICLQCPYMRESCDGPNVLAMEYVRWAEWARERIKRMGLARADVAEEAELSLSTVNSALSGAGYDIRTDTMRRITKAIIGGCWGQYPCHFAALLIEGADLEDGDKDSAGEFVIKWDLERAKFEEKERELRADYQAKIDYLKEQVVIRDKYLDQKNQMIDDLTRAIIRLSQKE